MKSVQVTKSLQNSFTRSSRDSSVENESETLETPFARFRKAVDRRKKFRDNKIHRKKFNNLLNCTKNIVFDR